MSNRIAKRDDIIIATDPEIPVEPDYCYSDKSVRIRPNFNLIAVHFRRYGYVPRGTTIYTIGSTIAHSDDMESPFDAEAAAEAPQPAPTPAADKSPAPVEKPAQTPLEALAALPDIDADMPRTTEQNSEFHGLIGKIADKLNKKPSDVKRVIVTQCFDVMRHTKEMSYKEMEKLIAFTKGMAAAAGVNL